MPELKPWIGRPPDIEAPEIQGYVQVGHARLSMVTLSVVGLVLIPLWTTFFLMIVSLLGGRSEFSADFDLINLLLLIVVMVVVVLVHEAVHGAAAILLGAKPAFGVGPGFAYTTFFQPMKKSAYLIVGVAPLILISALCVAVALIWPALAGWMILAAVVNASGAIGDLWMAIRILRSPKGAVFYDLADGFAVYAPQATATSEG